MKNDFIDLLPKREKVMKPADFLNMSAEERANVKGSRFVPPAVGGDDFGRFVVILRHPVYSASDAE